MVCGDTSLYLPVRWVNTQLSDSLFLNYYHLVSVTESYIAGGYASTDHTAEILLCCVSGIVGSSLTIHVRYNLDDSVDCDRITSADVERYRISIPAIEPVCSEEEYWQICRSVRAVLSEDAGSLMPPSQRAAEPLEGPPVDG